MGRAVWAMLCISDERGAGKCERATRGETFVWFMVNMQSKIGRLYYFFLYTAMHRVRPPHHYKNVHRWLGMEWAVGGESGTGWDGNSVANKTRKGEKMLVEDRRPLLSRLAWNGNMLFFPLCVVRAL